MITLETAKKLKDAGLEWSYTNTKRGDFYLAEFQDGTEGIFTIGSDGQNVQSDIIVFTFLPRLDQLLTKIDGRMYLWEIKSHMYKKYTVFVFSKENIDGKTISADTPEEAAAQALLWILTDGGAWAEFHAAVIKKVLSSPDPGADIRERMAKLEAVAVAAESTPFRYCEDKTKCTEVVSRFGCPLFPLCQALAALGDRS